jgi:hypothetical protein
MFDVCRRPTILLFVDWLMRILTVSPGFKSGSFLSMDSTTPANSWPRMDGTSTKMIALPILISQVAAEDLNLHSSNNFKPGIR